MDVLQAVVTEGLSECSAQGRKPPSKIVVEPAADAPHDGLSVPKIRVPEAAADGAGASVASGSARGPATGSARGGGSARVASKPGLRDKSGNLVESTPEIAVRIKEVFGQFDKSRDGQLDKEELEKVLKTLGPSFTKQEIDLWCVELDPSRDGQVSVREFLDWIRQGSVGARMVFNAIKTTSEKRAVRIKETFQRYDKSGDGSLDIDELRETLKALGSFNIDEIRHVCADLDKNKDGEISFQEFEAWIKSHNKKKEIIKAKAILAPADNDGLEAVFYNFCGQGKADMDNKSFLKLVRDCGLLDKKLTETVIDLLWQNTKLKPKGERSIGFDQFEFALELTAEKKGVPHKDIITACLEVTRPMIQGTKAAAVRFHDDKSTYTGAHGGSKELSATPATSSSRTQLSRVQSAQKKLRKKPPVVTLDTVIDNSQLWKVFGAQTKAGLTLKRLYSPPSSPTPAFRGNRTKGTQSSQSGGGNGNGFRRPQSGGGNVRKDGGVGLSQSMSLPNIPKPWDVPAGGLCIGRGGSGTLAPV